MNELEKKMTADFSENAKQLGFSKVGTTADGIPFFRIHSHDEKYWTESSFSSTRFAHVEKSGTASSFMSALSAEFLDSPSAVLYDFEKQRRKGTMSFVGIVYHEDYVFAFGDRKSTDKDVNGKLREQPGRGDVRKVWKSDSFVCVSYGKNEFLRRKQNDSFETKDLNLVMESLVRNFNRPEDVVFQLYRVLRAESLKTGYGLADPINLIFAFKSYGKWQGLQAQVYSNMATMTTGFVEPETLAIGGESWYVSECDSGKGRKKLVEAGSEDELTAELELVVKKFDSDSGRVYNPVGRGFDVVRFDG